MAGLSRPRRLDIDVAWPPSKRRRHSEDVTFENTPLPSNADASHGITVHCLSHAHAVFENTPLPSVADFSHGVEVHHTSCGVFENVPTGSKVLYSMQHAGSQSCLVASELPVADHRSLLGDDSCLPCHGGEGEGAAAVHEDAQLDKSELSDMTVPTCAVHHTGELPVSEAQGTAIVTNASLVPATEVLEVGISGVWLIERFIPWCPRRAQQRLRCPSRR